MPVIQDHRTHELMIQREALLLLHLLRCLYKYHFLLLFCSFQICFMDLVINVLPLTVTRIHSSVRSLTCLGYLLVQVVFLQ